MSIKNSKRPFRVLFTNYVLFIHNVCIVKVLKGTYRPFFSLVVYKLNHLKRKSHVKRYSYI